ncbi:MAG TPA: hypothetical protein V6C65_04530 [Allocoleopsis sp.]
MAEVTQDQINSFRNGNGKNGTKLNDRPPYQAPSSNGTNGNKPPVDPHKNVERTLDLAVQNKAGNLAQAAQQGAQQAKDEVTTEFVAYTQALLDGTIASSEAKKNIRQVLGVKRDEVQSGTIEFSVPGDTKSFFSGFSVEALAGGSNLELPGS